MYAQVVFSIASFRSFTYRIPHTLISHVSVGVAVNAPFKNKLQLGYIVSTSDFSSYKGKLNDIDSLYEGQPNIPQDLWKTILWMSNYYMAPIGLCIKSALPNIYYKDYNTKKILYIDINTQFLDNFDSLTLSKNQKVVINHLKSINQPISASKLKNIIPNPYYTIDALYKKNLIKKIFYDSDEIKNNISKSEIVLSKKQNDIFNSILPSIKQSKNSNYLIHGIPGSGKTEIYVKLAQEAISMGKNVMVLIPEIILTTQMKKRFIKYFGENIAMWHSKMTNKEKKLTIKYTTEGNNK